MAEHHSAFLAGENVKIKPPSFLRQYLAPEWPYHHPLEKDCLEFAGAMTTISAISYYHGGDVLYQLRGIPGIWHEAAVEDYMLSDIDWEGYPPPAEYFEIRKIVQNGYGYVVVTSRDGVECLRKFADGFADLEVDQMRAVAKLRHFSGFTNRYGFHAPFRPADEIYEQIRDRQFRNALGIPLDTPLPNEEFTAELIAALEESSDYPAQRLYANKPYPAAGAPQWQRSASNPDLLERDRQLQLVCEFYQRATPHQRQAVRNWRSHEALYHFAHRMAVRALRQKTWSDVELGLAALSIQDMADGQLRDRTHLLAHFLILRRVAKRIEADFSAMVERIAGISTPYTARALRELASQEECRLPLDIEEFDDEYGPTIGWKH